MMTPEEFRLKVLYHASTSWAVAHPTEPAAHAVTFGSTLAEECVREATRLGLIASGSSVPSSAVAQPQGQPIMPPAMQGFTTAQPQQQPVSASGVQAAPIPQAPQVPMQMQPQQPANASGVQAAPHAQAAVVPTPQVPSQLVGTPMDMQPMDAPPPQHPIAQPAAQVVPAPPYAQQQQPQHAAAQPAPSQPAAVPQAQVIPGTTSYQPLGPNGPTIQIFPHAAPQQQQQQPQQIADTTLHAPQGPGYQPPVAPMGGTNKVVQQPMPQGFSALGSIGVQEKCEQRPMGQDTVVSPGNQSFIPQGSLPEVVTEKVTH